MAHRKVKDNKEVYYKETTWEEEKRITSFNEEHFDYLCAVFVPDLYLLWQHIQICKINPRILRPVLDAIGEVALSAQKSGKVIIDIRPHKKTGEPTLELVRGISVQEPNLGVLETNT